MRWIGFVAGIGLATQAVAQVPQPNAFSDRLAQLTPPERLGTLRRAILDSGSYCRRIGDGRFQQSFKNLKMWTVRCDSGADYGLFIGPDASVQVRLCRELPGLKLPACRLDGLKAGIKPPPLSRPSVLPR